MSLGLASSWRWVGPGLRPWVPGSALDSLQGTALPVVGLCPPWLAPVGGCGGASPPLPASPSLPGAPAAGGLCSARGWVPPGWGVPVWPRVSARVVPIVGLMVPSGHTKVGGLVMGIWPCTPHLPSACGCLAGGPVFPVFSVGDWWPWHGSASGVWWCSGSFPSWVVSTSRPMTG